MKKKKYKSRGLRARKISRWQMGWCEIPFTGHLFYCHNLYYHNLLSTVYNIFWLLVMPQRQHWGTGETSTNCTDCTLSWGKDTIVLYELNGEATFRHECISCTLSSHWISKQTNTVSRSNSSQTMLEGLYVCFMTCNVFLAGNSEVSLELQCFITELIKYIVCECDAQECHWCQLLLVW